MQKCLWNLCIYISSIQHVLHSGSWAGSTDNILSHGIQIPTSSQQGSLFQVSIEGDSSFSLSLFYIQPNSWVTKCTVLSKDSQVSKICLIEFMTLLFQMAMWQIGLFSYLLRWQIFRVLGGEWDWYEQQELLL